MERGEEHTAATAPDADTTPRRRHVGRIIGATATAVCCAVAGTMAGAMVFPAGHGGSASPSPHVALVPTLPASAPATASGSAPACQHAVTAPGSPAPLCVTAAGPAWTYGPAGTTTQCLQGCLAAAPLPAAGMAAPAAAPAPGAAAASPTAATAPPVATSGGTTPASAGGGPTKHTTPCVALPSLPAGVKLPASGQLTIKVAGMTVRLKRTRTGFEACGPRSALSLLEKPSIPKLPGVPPVPVSGGGSAPSLGDLPIPGL